MREIKNKPIITFSFLFITATAIGIISALKILAFIPLGEYRSFTTIIASIFLFYIFNILFYRIFIWKYPIIEGECIRGSKDEFVFQVYNLYYLLPFNLLFPKFIPIPLMRIIYIALGTKMGKNTYCVGELLDPPLVQLGENTIVGYESVLCSHAVEGDRVLFSKIVVGNNVTIGMRSIIMAGVTIEDGCIVAAGSIVKKNTHIKAGETWAGAPAKLLVAKNYVLGNISNPHEFNSNLAS